MKKSVILLSVAAMVSAFSIASALDTTPITPKAALGASKETQRIKSFGHNRSYCGITTSNEWMRQGRIGGKMLQMRVHKRNGESINFEEKAQRAFALGSDGICLALRTNTDGEDVYLQFDQSTLDTLRSFAVSEVVLSDKNYSMLFAYRVQDLTMIRQELDLEPEELLCLGNENAPITIIGTDGIRKEVVE